MNENYRHRQLLKLLEERQSISTQEIISLLDISPATARRDINKLYEQGRLMKVRNGAEVLRANFVQKSKEDISNIEEKQRIALAASKICQDSDSVLLTCGSTMLMLGESLCGKNVQIMTNYLPLANHLIENNHEDLVIIGGQYNRNKAITLSLNSQNETAYAANIMFTSGKGLTEEGLFKTDMIIANSEKQMSAQAEKYVVLLDSSKLGKKVGMLFQSLSDIDLLITGKEADSQIIQSLKETGLEIILV